ncbi:hypothetical protein EII20_09480 [Comamonadaceae bacterium OH2545_COT-014]|nr:hypothetical protein EII20_09480 [Comamonadaceae bacterium OH2545_COT-014]
MNERRLLALALRGMTAVALLACAAVGWHVARGPAVPDEATPGIRTARLAPGQWRWADAPAPPPGLPLAESASLRLLLLRTADGRLHAFHFTAVQGRPTVPVSAPPASLGSPGLPCDDITPDFATQDIACRQPRPGFEFAQRHRWSLDGRPLTPGTPPLPVAAGRETGGEWAPLMPSGTASAAMR